MPSTRVKITNSLPATQGFYGREDHELGEGYDMEGAGAKYVASGATMFLTMREADLTLARKIGAGVTIIDAPLQSAAPKPAAAAQLPAAADDGARAHEDLKPRTDNTADPAAAAAAGAPITEPVADQFEAMSDDQLRAFITDRDDEAPHHRLGRERLLKRARGQDDGAAAQSDEAV